MSVPLVLNGAAPALGASITNVSTSLTLAQDPGGSGHVWLLIDTEILDGDKSGTTVSGLNRASSSFGNAGTQVAASHSAGALVYFIANDGLMKAVSPWKFAETVLSAATASVTLPASGSIPAGYRDIEIYASVRGDTAANNVTLTIRINGDAGANYFDEINSQSGTTTTVPVEDTGTTSFRLGNISAATASANSFTRVHLRIADYAASKFKGFGGMLNRLDTGSAGGDAVAVVSGWWNQVAAVTSVTFAPSAGNLVGAGSTTTSVFTMVLWP